MESGMNGGSARVAAIRLPLDPVPDTELGRLYRYWRDRLVDGAPPSVRAIRPEELRFMLGRINLVDVLDAPRRFRYRLVGTRIAASAAVDMQGQLVSDLKPAFFARLVVSHFVEAFEQQAPSLHEIVATRGPVTRRYRRIVLPFAAEPGGGCVGALMTGTWYTDDISEVLGHPDFVNA
jgi:hypothetical protein